MPWWYGCIGVLPLEVVSNQNLSLVAADVMPGWAFTYFTLAAGAGATAKTLNVTLSWSPKPILVACDDGMLPRSWGTVSKCGVPYKILIAFFFIGLIPLLAGMDISLISKMGIRDLPALQADVLLCIPEPAQEVSRSLCPL